MDFLTLFLFYLVIGCVVTPVVAHSKGRNWFGWLVLGLLLPVIALLLVALLPSLKPQTMVMVDERGRSLAGGGGRLAAGGAGRPMDATRSTPAIAADERRPCPHCAEQIMKAAVKCRFCGEAVEAVSPALSSVGAAAAPPMPVTPCYRCAQPVPVIVADCPSCGTYIRSKKQAQANLDAAGGH